MSLTTVPNFYAEVAMGGLVLDIIIVFSYRMAVTWIGEYRSRNWSKTAGKLKAAHSQRGGYGLVQMTYEYAVADTKYTGLHSKCFLTHRSAGEFASLLPPESDLIVRYNPADPAESFIRESDHRE